MSEKEQVIVCDLYSDLEFQRLLLVLFSRKRGMVVDRESERERERERRREREGTMWPRMAPNRQQTSCKFAGKLRCGDFTGEEEEEEVSSCSCVLSSPNSCLWCASVSVSVCVKCV